MRRAISGVVNNSQGFVYYYLEHDFEGNGGRNGYFSHFFKYFFVMNVATLKRFRGITIIFVLEAFWFFQGTIMRFDQ